MNPYANQLNAYKEAKVKTASQGRIVVMLYDAAIRHLDVATSELDGSRRKLDMVHNSIVKAQEIVTELIVSLDFERGGDIARNLFSLYLFFNQQMMEANVSKQADKLRTVRRLMTDLRDAWEQAAKTQVADNSASQGVNIAG